jgi:hypothetical protein
MQLTHEVVERGLQQVVVEVEEHVNELGWDQPGRLFALAPTADLASEQPELAVELGITMAGADGALPLFTAIEQELDLGEEPLESMLARIEWPEPVQGTVAVLHRLVLPPEAEADVPDDPMDAGAFALAHPQRREVRMGVGVARSGAAHCVIRIRTDGENSEGEAVLQGRDLVPGLVSALRATLDPDVEEDLDQGERPKGGQR